MITGQVRFSYLNAFEPKATPSGDLKYSASLLIPKEDKKSIQVIQSAIKDAIQVGIEKGKFNKAQVKALKLPLRDGDKEFDSGNRGPEYQGHYFLNATSANAPGVVKAQKNGPPVPIIDADDFFSGCFGRADVNFFPYSAAGNKGVGVGLNNLLLVKEGERLDGRMKAEDAFSEFTDEDIDKEVNEVEEAPFDTDKVAGDLE